MYSVFTFRGVKYTIPSGYIGFSFCRGVNCGDSSVLGFAVNDYSVVHAGKVIASGMGGWSDSNWSGSPSAPTIDEQTLAAAIGTTTTFEVVYNT